ncbi:hypothetical protein BCR35DRAFT_322888 [Leucosporidium creatinivorum]|uniref:Fe2OG dioxygenase domain-containing protein n=1 Tax=Leucosporidium creatinivorum TaxID=106004 RepID=A0A1Y2CL92_9BASI|nr:hypothetical protein BCR35DRAFT_322888 [Leucosporidium creatinivorum]
MRSTRSCTATSTATSLSSPAAVVVSPPTPVSPSSSSKRPTSSVSLPSKRPRSTNQQQPTADPQEPSPSSSQAVLPPSSRLPLKDAEIYYLPTFITEEKAKGWYDELLEVGEWYQPKLKVYGKEIVQSRKIAAYSTDPNLSVRYSGTQVQMHYDYPPLLTEIQELVERELGTRFNHCMMNLYEDGNVYIGAHRDNKENRVIASLSLGASRTFILTHSAHNPHATTPAPSTPSGSTDADAELQLQLQTKSSFLLNPGKTQEKWKHEIPKEFASQAAVKKAKEGGVGGNLKEGMGKRRVEEGRISLTFRQLSG